MFVYYFDNTNLISGVTLVVTVYLTPSGEHHIDVFVSG